MWRVPTCPLSTGRHRAPRPAEFGSGIHSHRVGYSRTTALMEFHPELLRQLDLLSETLGDGTDLHAVLGVLADDLSLLIPTFLGLDLHLSVAGIPVMLSAVSAGRDAPVRAS